MNIETARDLMSRLRSEAESSGYLLNPDQDMVLSLMEGLLVNTERFGYPACPCMEADGVRELDRDIICPCDYRDQDLDEFGTCYCALYVSEEVVSGKHPLKPIPLRRPSSEDRRELHEEKNRHDQRSRTGSLKHPVWRCQVCGYLCARPSPPLKCPVCKVDKDRFEQFL